VIQQKAIEEFAEMDVYDPDDSWTEVAVEERP